MTWIKIACFYGRQFALNLIEKRLEHRAQTIGQILG